MTKINRVNIAITGDSKGLTAATDAATRELRRLQMESDKTKARLRDLRGSAMQSKEALGQLGIRGGALGAFGAAAGIAALGPQGLALAGAGAAAGGVSMAVMALRDAISQIPAERKAAVEAIRQINRDQRRSLAEFGFTGELAAAVSARGERRLSAAEGLGFRGGLARGIAGTDTPAGRLAQMAVNEIPGALGVGAGTLFGGGGAGLARTRMGAMMSEGRSPMEIMRMTSDVMGAVSAGRQVIGGAQTFLNAANPVSNALTIFNTAKMLWDNWSR